MAVFDSDYLHHRHLAAAPRFKGRQNYRQNPWYVCTRAREDFFFKDFFFAFFSGLQNHMRTAWYVFRCVREEFLYVMGVKNTR